MSEQNETQVGVKRKAKLVLVLAPKDGTPVEVKEFGRMSEVRKVVNTGLYDVVTLVRGRRFTVSQSTQLTFQ